MTDNRNVVSARFSPTRRWLVFVSLVFLCFTALDLLVIAVFWMFLGDRIARSIVGDEAPAPGTFGPAFSLYMFGYYVCIYIAVILALPATWVYFAIKARRRLDPTHCCYCGLSLHGKHQCGYCGSIQVNICRKCGYDLRYSARRCPECGIDVAAAGQSAAPHKSQ